MKKEKKEDEKEVAIRFHLPANEVLVQLFGDINMKAKFKTTGKLYLFQRHLIFEYIAFGMDSKETFSLEKVKEVSFDEKKSSILVVEKGNKREFTGFNDAKQTFNLVYALWQESIKTTQFSSNTLGKKASTQKVGNTITRSNAAIKEEGGLILSQRDKEILFKGAIEKTFKPGESIVVEGGKAFQRLFNIQSGTCAVQKVINGQVTNLAKMSNGSFFGELSFLEEGTNATATASVVSEGEVTVQILEGWYINLLFVEYPDLAGKFYSYLCSVIAKRLNEREMAVKRAAIRGERRGTITLTGKEATEAQVTSNGKK